MGQQLVAQMLPVLEKMTWTGSQEVTSAGSIVFQTVIDQLDGFRGDPNTLSAALRTIRTCDSLPYTYAGVAYTLMTASAETNDTYDLKGLQAAQTWLERAQDLSPDVVEINVIEALIYIFARRLEDARMVLDYLHSEAPDNYFVLRAEMYYWQREGDLSAALDWTQRAMRQAVTVPQRLRLKSLVGDLYLEAGDTTQALRAFKEALHFDSENAWLCHRISTIHYQREELEEALRFNQRALRLQVDFPEAQALHEKLTEGQESSGFFGKLFG